VLQKLYPRIIIKIFTYVISHLTIHLVLFSLNTEQGGMMLYILYTVLD